MKFTIAAFTLMCLVQVRSECCGSTYVEFVPLANNRACRDVVPGSKVKPGHVELCQFYMCDDGKAVPGGLYCGRGPCNVFGCNCDGGCVAAASPYPHNAFRNFQDRYGKKVHRL